MRELLVPITVKKLKEGGYLATSSILRGLVAQGRTVAETLEIAEDVARKLIESLVENGDPIPASLRPNRHGKPSTFKLETRIPVAA